MAKCVGRHGTEPKRKGEERGKKEGRKGHGEVVKEGKFAECPEPEEETTQSLGREGLRMFQDQHVPVIIGTSKLPTQRVLMLSLTSSNDHVIEELTFKSPYM